MSRPPTVPAEKKLRIVLSVLQGEITIAEAARREKVSEQAIGNWKRQFLEGGKAGIEAGKSKPSTREQQLEDEVAELTTALGEAVVEIRVWKKSAEGRLAGLQAFGSHDGAHRLIVNGVAPAEEVGVDAAVAVGAVGAIEGVLHQDDELGSPHGPG